MIEYATEAQFQAAVIDLARMAGWRVLHFYDSRRSVGAGWPDLVLAKPPRILFVELKRKGGKTTTLQDEWIEILSQCGCEAYVWRPSDWGYIEETLVKKTTMPECSYAVTPDDDWAQGLSYGNGSRTENLGPDGLES